MNKMLIAIPTEIELHSNYFNDINDNFNVDLLITGIGIHSTTFNLTRYLSKNRVSFVLHAGICGSFKQEYPMGTVVQIVSDTFADFGVEQEDEFIHASKIFNEPLWYENDVNISISIPKVKGITVNSITSNRKRLNKLVSEFNPDVETMENAAVLYVCQQSSIPVLLLRSVSNYVGERNKNNWDIPLAIENLWLTLKKIVETFHA